ncbi:MAG: hypothetical protein QG553_577 [Patescibacteria group bacterium]|nr:hypothetical protein [Patescibacteria group bacterium]
MENRNPTPYKDVNQVLSRLSDGLVNVFGNQLVGLYLTGSLTYGDFEPGSSDIDFLAVLENEPSMAEVESIKALHKEIAKAVPLWAKRLEGSYLSKDLLSIDRPVKERPYVNNGEVKLCLYGNEWIINLYALQEAGITLIGRPLADILPEVKIGQVRQASLLDLKDDWLPKLNDSKAFDQPDYDSSHIKAYTVLTMCRILHRANNDGVASKRVATKWVKQTYPEWSDLVTQAEQWQHGMPMPSDELVKDFIRFTRNELI